jgi:hypothetical protein
MPEKPFVAEIISLESAILALTMGRPPNPPWARLSSAAAFVEELKILIRYLTTPTDDRVPPFLRIVDADPHWRHYLFGRQRPEARVETMSWYWRFLLMMTLVRQLNWTCKLGYGRESATRRNSVISLNRNRPNPPSIFKNSADTPMLICEDAAERMKRNNLANSAARRALT